MTHFLTEHFGRLWAIGLLPVILPPLLYGWHKRQITIRHPSLRPHADMPRRWSTCVIGCYLALSAVALFSVLSLMEPRSPSTVTQHLEQKRNECMFVDRSGSMESILDQGIPELADDEAQAENDPGAKVVSNGGSDQLIVSSQSRQAAPSEDMVVGQSTRIDGAYLATRYMIRHGMADDPDETDRYCLMSFDTDTYVMAPLSTDKQVLLLRTEHIKENVGGGTNFFGPTNDETGVGPLQKALDFYAKYTSPGSVNVVIIITDGYDSGDPVRMQQLLADYQAAHLRLYVIGLGDAWTDGEQLDLESFADAIHAQDPTNGLVFKAQNPGEMKQAMQTIARLEKSPQVIEAVQNFQETPFWYLIGAAASALILAILTLVVRRIP